MTDSESRKEQPELLFDAMIEKEPVRGPLTLAMLFYVVTLGAIVSACLRSLVGDNQVTSVSMTWMIGAGVVVGSVGGAIFGRLYLRQFRAGALGVFLGAIVGGLSSALAMVNGENFTEIMTVTFVGCWLLVVVMMVSSHFRPQDAPTPSD